MTAFRTGAGVRTATVLVTGAALLAALLFMGGPVSNGAPAGAKRIAFLVDSWHPISHADVIGARFLEGYRMGGRTYSSPVTVSVLYQSEPRATQMGPQLASKYGIKLASSVADALLDDPRASQPKLAVDGVLIAVRTPLPTSPPTGESGQFRVFKETMAAFDRAGARVPVFVDKNLAATWDESQTIMAEAAKRNVPVMAGSVVPWVPPDPTPPSGRRATIGIAVASAPYHLYAIHVAELLQAFMETRGPREVGVTSVREVGDGYWSMPDKEGWGEDVLRALLPTARTRNLRFGGGGSGSWVVLVQYADGARGVVALIPRAFDDLEFLLGARYEGQSTPYLGSVLLGKAPYDHFGYLAHGLIQFYSTGRSPIPAERTLLSTGISLFGMRSREAGGRALSAPSLAVSYQVGPR
jgi:hypothetical protein